MQRLTEQQAKEIIFQAQAAGYPNKNIPEILAPLYKYIEQVEAENSGLRANSLIQEHIIDSNKNPKDKEKIVELIMKNTALSAELEQHKKALKLACRYILKYSPGLICEPVRDMAYFLLKAKAGDSNG